VPAGGQPLQPMGTRAPLFWVVGAPGRRVVQVVTLTSPRGTCLRRREALRLDHDGGGRSVPKSRVGNLSLPPGSPLSRVVRVGAGKRR
jgi:hypothetical protein